MNRFQIQQQIGHGAYSVVLRGIDKLTQKTVAVKKMNHTTPEIKMVLHREIKILQKFSHPNIIKLLDIFSDETFTYLIFQYMPCDLIGFYKDIKKKKFRCLNDGEVCYIMYQIAEGLAAMHKKGIMHRDIKPENILINPKTLEIKLIDFGFATESNNYGKNTQYMITRWYRPLEIVLGLPYDIKVDIFSLGALMIQLYQCEEIFRSASNIDQMYWIIEVCGYPSWRPALNKMTQLGIAAKPYRQPTINSMVKKLRPEAASLILGMLHTNPQKRMTIQQILMHPYFLKYNSNAVKQNSKNSTPQTTTTPRSLLHNESNSVGKAYFKGNQLLLGSSPRSNLKTKERQNITKDIQSYNSQKVKNSQEYYLSHHNEQKNSDNNRKIRTQKPVMLNYPSNNVKFQLNLNNANTETKKKHPTTDRDNPVYKSNELNTNNSNSQPYFLNSSRKLSSNNSQYQYSHKSNTEGIIEYELLTSSNHTRKHQNSQEKARNFFQERKNQTKNAIATQSHYYLPQREASRRTHEKPGISRFGSNQNREGLKRNMRYNTAHLRSQNSDTRSNFYSGPRLSINTEGAEPIKKMEIQNDNNYYLQRQREGRNTPEQTPNKVRTRSTGMRLVSMRKDISNSQQKKNRVTSLSGHKANRVNISNSSNLQSEQKKYANNYGQQMQYHSNISAHNYESKITNSYTYNFHSQLSNNNKHETANRKGPVFSKIRGKLVPDKQSCSSKNKIKISLAEKKHSLHGNYK